MNASVLSFQQYPLQVAAAQGVLASSPLIWKLAGGCGCGRAITSRAARVLRYQSWRRRPGSTGSPLPRVVSRPQQGRKRGGGGGGLSSLAGLPCPGSTSPDERHMRGAISFFFLLLSLKIRLRSSRGPLDWMYSYSYTRRATSNDWSLAQPAAERR